MALIVSPRLIDQRLRNRIMEVLEVVAAGTAGVHSVGASEFFELFYDLLPYGERGKNRSNTAISNAEWAAIGTVRSLMDDACDSTSACIREADLNLSGWPDRIQPAAEAALKLMWERGRFSEDVEEAVPTQQE
ncbi:hypothetical protein [Roseinatronobacter alkalisoli]|uniref:Uncharacterized protein n=1 Tax=Roseinatronobacter alkalisoli TaxID=3028235 RepID=A0ABT5TIX9_9RHOB|nr:hypothetical protein [Roseinatronobacter sp. HJB301]MDD7973908.1 hypothetical protein [Roseinatronobacter sp. HJB301]